MIDAGAYSHSDKALHVFDDALFAIIAGIAATVVVYAIVSRKFLSVGIAFILSAVVVLQDYFIKKLHVRPFIDLVIPMIGLCVGWFDRKIRKRTDS